MRRFLLIVLMLVLPLQWSWAAVASVCEHEDVVSTTHVGHHEHEHHGPDVEPQTEAPADGQAVEHLDCGVCHGMGSLVVAADAPLTLAWDGQASFAPYRAVIPDRSPDTLLRPPLALVS